MIAPLRNVNQFRQLIDLSRHLICWRSFPLLKSPWSVLFHRHSTPAVTAVLCIRRCEVTAMSGESLRKFTSRPEKSEPSLPLLDSSPPHRSRLVFPSAKRAHRYSFDGHKSGSSAGPNQSGHNLLLQVALCPDCSSPVAVRIALLPRRTRSLQ